MSSRHPLRGDAAYTGTGPPRLYPVRNLPPVMIAGPPSLSPRPLMGFIPYSHAPLPQQPTHMMYPYRLHRPTEHRMVVPTTNMIAVSTPAGVDLRSQPIQPALPAVIKQTMTTHPAAQPLAATSSDQPLDLSVKAKSKSTPTPVQERLIDTHKIKDVPLDLSKPSRPTVKEEMIEKPINMATFNKSAHTKMFPSPNYAGRTNSSQATQGATFSGFTPPSETAVRSGRSSTPSHSSDSESNLMNSALQSMSSVSSLIGNHPIDDILYLHCKRCQSSYGSVHAFRKHFRNVHGTMPSSDDVLIQGIKATKEFEANKTELSSSASIPHRFHCTYCGWQGDQNNHTTFTRHLNEHYEENGRIYKCFYCKEMMSDANSLKLHLSRHTGVFLNPCPLCFIAFETEAQLSLHFTRQHRMVTKQPKIAPAPISLSTTSPFQMTNALPLPYRSTTNGFQFQPTILPNPINDNHSKRLAAPSTQQALSKMPHTSVGWCGPPVPSPSKPEALSELQRRPNAETTTCSLSSPLKLNYRPASASFAPPAVAAGSSSSISVNSSAGSLHSVLNAAVSLAVSSANATDSSSGTQRTQINLMSLLDKVVEQGLRNAESSSPPASVNLRSVVEPSPAPLSPSTSKDQSQLEIIDNDTPTSSTPTISSSVVDLTQTQEEDEVQKESAQSEKPTAEASEAPATAHKMAEKSLFDHITEAVTRELIAQQASTNNHNADNQSENNGTINCNGSSNHTEDFIGDQTAAAAATATGGENDKRPAADDTNSTINEEDIDIQSESDDNLPPAFVIDESVDSLSLNAPQTRVTKTAEADTISASNTEQAISGAHNPEALKDAEVPGEDKLVADGTSAVTDCTRAVTDGTPTVTGSTSAVTDGTPDVTRETLSAADGAPAVSRGKPLDESKTDTDSEASSPKRLRIDLDSGTDS